MLTDLERKLLRIIFNYSFMRSKMPEICELETKTGRTISDIIKGIEGLEQKEFIRWDGKPQLDHILILQDSEMDVPRPSAVTAGSSDTAYWTSY